MKKFYMLALLAGLVAAGCSKNDLGADRLVTDDFDPLFALELQSRGYIDNASYITPAQVQTIETLDISGSSSNYGVLTSLRGIEYFTSLKELICSSNQLTALDVSRNSALTVLECNNNQLTELNVSNNTALTELQCSNNHLTELEVSNNKELTLLACSANKLTVLDVSRNTALIELLCSNNGIASLLLPNSLEHLSCDWNDLVTIDGIAQCRALKTLHCYSCGLYSLDITQNKELEELYCAANKLTSLDLSQNAALIKLHCYNNVLTSLDITQNKNLVELSCTGNIGAPSPATEDPGTEGDDDGSENPGTEGDGSEDTGAATEGEGSESESAEETTNDYVFAVTSWFDNDNVPSGASEEGMVYAFTTGSWSYDVLNPDGSVNYTYTVTIDYRKVE